MKEIKVVIEDTKLHAVLTALGEIPSMPGPIVSDVRAFCRGSVDPESEYHGIDPVNSRMMMKVECVVPDSLAPQVVEAIRGAAHTGNADEEAIVIINVEDRIKNLRQPVPTENSIRPVRACARSATNPYSLLYYLASHSCGHPPSPVWKAEAVQQLGSECP